MKLRLIMNLHSVRWTGDSSWVSKNYERHLNSILIKNHSNDLTSAPRQFKITPVSMIRRLTLSSRNKKCDENGTDRKPRKAQQACAVLWNTQFYSSPLSIVPTKSSWEVTWSANAGNKWRGGSTRAGQSKYHSKCRRADSVRSIVKIMNMKDNLKEQQLSKEIAVSPWPPTSAEKDNSQLNVNQQRPVMS